MVDEKTEELEQTKERTGDVVIEVTNEPCPKCGKPIPSCCTKQCPECGRSLEENWQDLPPPL